MQTDPDYDVPCSEACDSFKDLFLEKCSVIVRPDSEFEELIQRDRRASWTMHLFFEMMNSAAPITINGIHGQDYDANAVYKAASALTHYLWTAPGNEEAARTLGIAVIAYAKQVHP